MRWKELLTEGRDRYLDMYEPLLAVTHNDPDIVRQSCLSRIKSFREVNSRSDILTYFLRWDRLAFYITGPFGFEPQDIETDKLLARLAKSVGCSPHQAMEDVRAWERRHRSELGHFAGSITANLTAPNIAAFQWNRQAPSSLAYQFSEWEKDWQANRDAVIPKTAYQGELPEVFLKVDNQWAWYDLKKTTCDLEGQAMGHCGNNQLNALPNETILSLRRVTENGFRPSLTFIYNTESGYLGEMKGRANSKPATRYHPAIVKLLNDPRIKGITGGGHDPMNNFSIFDLGEQKAFAMLKQKPDLISLQQAALYWRENRDEGSKKIVERLAQEWFQDEHIGVIPERNIVGIARYPLSVWERFPNGDAPTSRITAFWEEYDLPDEALQPILVQTVPHDLIFDLDDCEAEYDPKTKMVLTYIPYEGLYNAFSPAMYSEDPDINEIDTHEAPDSYEMHEDVAKDYYADYRHDLDVTNVGLPPSLARSLFDVLLGADDDSDPSDKLALAKKLKELFA